MAPSDERYSFKSIGLDSVANAPCLQVAIAPVAVATVQQMHTDQIQAHRKERLQAAIDAFWGGVKIAFARELRNKDGEPLRDGSYVGQLLKPMDEKNARPIDEDRVREIESLRPGLRGWFTQHGDAKSQIDLIRGHVGANTQAMRQIVPRIEDLANARGHATILAAEDLAPFTLRGFEVTIDTNSKDPKAACLVAVESAGGCVLGIYRPTVAGFEVDAGRGVVLDSVRHGLRVIGVAIETRRSLIN